MPGDDPTPVEPPDGSSSLEEAPVRLLIVEDDEDDFLITCDMLDDQDRMAVTTDWAQTYEEALEKIRGQNHDAYLIDYRLGGRTGLELIRAGFAARPVAPIVLLTGQPTAEVDLEARALGATDILPKRTLGPDELERAIRHAISHHKAERHALAARATEDGVWDWDLAADVVYLSPMWNVILGLPAEASEVPPARWFERVVEDDAGRLRAEIDAHLAGRTSRLECEFRMMHRDGTPRWVEVQGLASRDVDGAPIRIAGSITDTTGRHADRQRLEHEALHDTLTGLPNRTLFLDRVEQTLQRAMRDSSAGCALLFLDLDEFKQVNDTLSHAVGDKLLVAFAQRIAGALRPGDTVARLGGDEFTVLLEGLVTSGEATVVADRILRAMRRPFEIDGNDLHVGVSVGIALSAEGLSPGDLIGAADVAMYDAKRRGRGRWALFDEHMHRRVAERQAHQDELREVIERGLLEVHFQPIVALDDERIVGLEALARWPTDRAPLAPEQFVSIAEETVLIGALGEHVMHGALAALAAWQRDGLAGENLWVSVNLSARQLSDAGLVDRLRGAAAATGLEAGRLRLELAESTLATLERNEPAAAALREHAIGLHVDEFGTGYSSLTALHRLPIAALKIARPLVAAVEDEANRRMARSVIALAHSLDVAAVGAGIEEPGQREALRALGCDLGQGVLLGPVAGPEEISDLLARAGGAGFAPASTGT